MEKTKSKSPLRPSREKSTITKIPAQKKRANSCINFPFIRKEKFFLDFYQKAEKNNLSSFYSNVQSSETKRNRNEEIIDSLKKFQKESLIEKVFFVKDFELQMLNQINAIRTKSLAYCKKIYFYSKFIEELSGKKYLYIDQDDDPSIYTLVRGVSAFEETIILLQTLNQKMIDEKFQLEKLVHIDELKIPFPNFNINLAKDISYIDSQFEEIKKNLKGKYEVTHHHYDVTYKDADISTLMQLVDDNYCQKRRQRNLLRKQTKYVGINYGNIDNNLIVVYLVFAK